jgi:ATP-binding cassette subfamily B multidrug efflux pump
MAERQSKSQQSANDEAQKPSAAATPPAATKPDDDVVGKAYDGLIMRRLFTYLKPYKLQAGISAVSILLKAATDIAGPFLLAIAVDTYLAPSG